MGRKRRYVFPEEVKDRVERGLRWLSTIEAAYYMGIAPRTLYEVAGKSNSKLIRNKFSKFDRKLIDKFMESKMKGGL